MQVLGSPGGFELTCDSTRGGMQEPAQVDADAEGKDVELQRNAVAVVEFQVQMRSRLEVDTGVEAVITD